MAYETLGADDKRDVVKDLGLPGLLEASVLDALAAQLRQTSDLQDTLPEAPEEIDSVFREDIWNGLKMLAEQHTLPADSQSIADAETLVASHHPDGDTAVIAAVGQEYGKWSSGRKRAARTLAGLYRATIIDDFDMAVVAPIHAFGEGAEDTEPLTIETPEGTEPMEGETRPELLTSEPRLERPEPETPQVQPDTTTATHLSEPKAGTRDKRLAKDRTRADNGNHIEPHEVGAMLKEFQQLEVSEQRQQVGQLLADALDIPRHLVTRVLDPTDTSRLRRDETSALLKIRNAIGFIPNRKAAGYKHFGLLPAIREICNSHDANTSPGANVNALLGTFLGFRVITKGKGQEAKRVVVTTGLQTQSIGAAVRSPHASSSSMGERYILQGLMIVGTYAEAAKATDAQEVAS